MSIDWLALALGSIVGISLWLTGGGGSIFAVPLLIYGMGIGIREAAGLSLVAVGVTALIGGLLKIREKSINFPAALAIGIPGMIAAPWGVKFGQLIPEGITIFTFALLMVVIGVRMWKKSTRSDSSNSNRSVCQSKPDGRIQWDCKCHLMLLGVGTVVGILSGIFGVGGGFLIVPALVFVAGLTVRLSIATSLWVVAAVALAGAASNYLAGINLDLAKGGWFLVGGCLGMFLGIAGIKRVTDRRVNQVFAVGVWVVAVVMLLKTTVVGIG